MGQVGRRRIRYGMRTWFRTSPRRHGEVIDEREVSFLELFYDLVYVVLIGRTTHHLAAHVTGRSVVEFAVVFGLIWLAWFNGTFWHELHGREDGRSRNYIFVQMGLLALLAVFAGGAAGDDGQGFAIVYSILFALLTWQWWQVHRIDTDRRYRPTTMRYLVGMGTSTAVVLASAFVGSRLAPRAVGSGRDLLGRRWLHARLDGSHGGIRRRCHRVAGRADGTVHHHRARRVGRRCRGWHQRRGASRRHDGRHRNARADGRHGHLVELLRHARPPRARPARSSPGQLARTPICRWRWPSRRAARRW